jgi:uncharacterized protein YuzE
MAKNCLGSTVLSGGNSDCVVISINYRGDIIGIEYANFKDKLRLDPEGNRHKAHITGGEIC